MKKQNKEKKQRRFVLGDVHGRFDYLLDVLKKSKFDYKNDLLIFVGDVMDRGLNPFQCIDELLKIKNKILIKGNHDTAFVEWIETNYSLLGIDNSNGVRESITAWQNLTLTQREHYKKEFFSIQKDYYIAEDNIIFTHGGFDRKVSVRKQVPQVFQWDRELILQSMSCNENHKLKTEDNFKEIFIGHTPTIYWDKTIPISNGGIINIDTGSGKGGPLTIMNIDTKQYWQSDLSKEDYLKLKSYGIIKETKENSGKKEKQASV